MKESDFQQYIASSDEDLNSIEDGNNSDDSDAVYQSKNKMSRKALGLRKLLLGDADETSKENDDFFLQCNGDYNDYDTDNDGDSDSDSDGGGDGDGVHDRDKEDEEKDDIVANSGNYAKVVRGRNQKQKFTATNSDYDHEYTYIPEEKDTSENKLSSHGKADKTPIDRLKAKLADKKKARKLKLANKMKSSSDSKSPSSVDDNDYSSRKNDVELTATLTSMFSPRDKNEKADYDMRSIIQLERAKLKYGEKLEKKKFKKKRSSGNSDYNQSDSFAVDTSDKRFTAVFSDPRFGIDVSSTEYKETDGMRQILAAKRIRNIDRETDAYDNKMDKLTADEPSNTQKLVEKLKKKLKA